LITGGSLGAEAFAKFIPEVISTLPKKIQKSIVITQQVREDQLSKLESVYSSMSIRHFCSTFFDDMPNQMAKADIIISRAGAASIAEIAAIGRAALLIPFPYSLDDHQIYNARSLADKNAAIILHQKEIETDPSILAKELLSLIKNPVKCEKLAVKARNLAHKHALNDIISSIKSFQHMNSGGIR
jgi:UDP-N-acetylglucosamine--N-acetylmuramyl-(pentapeptide) pyrophosphoryl-undecaprenol N-acetylglucosamine transferase